MSTSVRTTTFSHATVASTARTYDAYPIHIPHELSPGMMSDGTISTNHPCVERFLAHIARKFLQAEALAAEVGEYSNPAWHTAHKHQAVTWWRFEKGGIARVDDVHAALGDGVTPRLADAIFALAALAVFSHWTHEAHWAFWSKNAFATTAELVDRVVHADPKDIYVPDQVAWINVEMARRVLNVWHAGWFTTAKGKIPHPSVEGERQPRISPRTSRKRVAEDGPSAPSAKRRRVAPTTTTPARRSPRKCQVAEVSCIATEGGPSTAPVEIAEPVLNEPEGMMIDVEMVDKAEDMGAGLEERPAAPQIANKSRPKRARARKLLTMRKGNRARRVSAPSGPLPEQSLPPSAFPCIIRIPPRSAPSSPTPATREMAEEVPVLPCLGEMTAAAASPESTVVGTPFSGGPTRVGTPQPDVEAKVELPKAVKLKVVKAKVVKPKAVPEGPVRTSARIRTAKDKAQEQ